MKSQALQKMVRDIFSNETTKAQFESNPEGVLSRYSLTSQERTAVLNTYKNMGLVTSDTPQMEAAIEPMGTWT